MTNQTTEALAEILKKAQQCGLAHNNGAGGQYLLCATEAQLLAFGAALSSQPPAPREPETPAQDAEELERMRASNATCPQCPGYVRATSDTGSTP